jgi:hypothetical protein
MQYPWFQFLQYNCIEIFWVTCHNRFIVLLSWSDSDGQMALSSCCSLGTRDDLPDSQFELLTTDSD